MEKNNITEEIAKIISLNKRIYLHLNEFQVLDLIKEEKIKIEKEQDSVFDITKIPIDSLERQDIDYRLLNLGVTMDNPLFFMNEDKEDKTSRPLEEVRDAMVQKYQFEPWQFRIVKGKNKIFVSMVIALQGENEQMILQDMDRFGYFCAMKLQPQTLNGHSYSEMKFEPLFQNDESEIIRQYAFLYHVTPIHNVKNIMNQGLLPKNSNEFFHYPPRIYLLKGNVPMDKINYIAKLLYKVTPDEKKEIQYAVLTLDTKKIPEEVKFYFDPNYEYGIFADSPIPADAILNVWELKVD